MHRLPRPQPWFSGLASCKHTADGRHPKWPQSPGGDSSHGFESDECYNERKLSQGGLSLETEHQMPKFLVCQTRCANAPPMDRGIRTSWSATLLTHLHTITNSNETHLTAAFRTTYISVLFLKPKASTAIAYFFLF